MPPTKYMMITGKYWDKIGINNDKHLGSRVDISQLHHWTTPGVHEPPGLRMRNGQSLTFCSRKFT